MIMEVLDLKFKLKTYGINALTNSLVFIRICY